MGFTERLIELDCLERRLAPQRVRLADRHDVVAAQQCVGVGQAAVGPRVRRVERDGLLKVVSRFVQSLDCVLGPMVAPSEIVLVGEGIVRLTIGAGMEISQRHPKARHRPPCNRSSHLALEHEDILRVALVLFHPDVALSLHLDELRRDSGAIADSSKARLEQIADAELPPDLVGSLRCVLVVHRRRARDDPQSRRVDAAEDGDHLLGQPVAEVLLFGIAGQVLKRQNRQHDPTGRRGRPRDLQGKRCVAAGDQCRHSKRKRRATPDGHSPSGRRRHIDCRRRFAGRERQAVRPGGERLNVGGGSRACDELEGRHIAAFRQRDDDGIRLRSA